MPRLRRFQETSHIRSVPWHNAPPLVVGVFQRTSARSRLSSQSPEGGRILYGRGRLRRTLTWSQEIQSRLDRVSPYQKPLKRVRWHNAPPLVVGVSCGAIPSGNGSASPYRPLLMIRALRIGAENACYSPWFWHKLPWMKLRSRFEANLPVWHKKTPPDFRGSCIAGGMIAPRTSRRNLPAGRLLRKEIL
jgi:hypothetical protein